MYEEFYGFDKAPFRLTPDPEFYFQSATHRKALSHLDYGLQQQEGFVIITGEIGAGKTILVERFVNELASANVTIGKVAASASTGEAMLFAVASSFGLNKAQERHTAQATIERFLRNEALEGRRTMLFVDEAQALSVDALEALRMLSNTHLSGQPIIQVVLLGQPRLRDELAEAGRLEELRQRIIASHHLEAMSAQEIEPYVLHRLTRAGWRGLPTFDGELWHRLGEVTGGIPRKINQVMTRLLLLGSIEQADRLDLAMLNSVLEEMSPDGNAHRSVESRENLATSRGEDAQEVEGRTDEAISSDIEDTKSSADKVEEELSATEEISGSDDYADLRKVEEIQEQLDAIELAFAERDAHLHALRELIENTADAQPARPSYDDRLDRRLSDLEDRVSEQERSLRNILQTMIEHFETRSPSEMP
ncbi:general secretion pathway protein [Erythrobacter litoralis]|uniref:ExeA family protein n=1 Tax=Erythrobacter litoralis TaxID=39960 RepID=UPI00243537DB|nr:AAA family ATPase [Erythrobacter litoralis]MDG6078277.1 general secretion pathway protein [Erythrobacter litoralis]